jgi:hypothetical protein
MTNFAYNFVNLRPISKRSAVLEGARNPLPSKHVQTIIGLVTISAVIFANFPPIS